MLLGVEFTNTIPVEGYSDLELEMSSIQVVFEAPHGLHCGPIQTPTGAQHQTEKHFQIFKAKTKYHRNDKIPQCFSLSSKIPLNVKGMVV